MVILKTHGTIRPKTAIDMFYKVRVLQKLLWEHFREHYFCAYLKLCYLNSPVPDTVWVMVFLWSKFELIKLPGSFNWSRVFCT